MAVEPGKPGKALQQRAIGDLAGIGRDPGLGHAATGNQDYAESNRGYGGGIWCAESNRMLVQGNRIHDNVASAHGEGQGGGIWTNSGNYIVRTHRA